MADAPLLSPAPRDASVLTAQRKLLVGTGLCFAFMLAEIIGGLMANSLAVMTDAAHMLSDVAGFLVSVIALMLSSRQANAEYSFGFHRAEVLGAVASIFVIWLMTGILVWEAVLRLITPDIVEGKVMFIVSVIGILMNLILMRVFGHNHSHGGASCDHGHSHGHAHEKPAKSSYKPPVVVAVSDSPHEHEHSSAHGHAHGHDDHAAPSHAHAHGEGEGHNESCGHEHGHGEQAHEHGHEHEHEHEHEHGLASPHAEGEDEESLAVRAAMAHVLGDILQSLGVCLSAALIWAFNDRWLDANGISYWYRTDPICTFLFSILVLWSTVGTIREAVHVLMAGVPRGINPSAVLAQLRAIPNVLEVHDLHVWSLVGNKRNMWAHLTVTPGADSTPVLTAAQRVARLHNCMHTCFQVEDSGTYDKSVEGHHCYDP